MAIIGNVGVGLKQIGIADTVVYELAAPVERYSITECSVYNTSGADIDLEAYLSPNLTTASGNIVSKITIPSNENMFVDALLGVGTSLNVIAKASAVGLNLTLTKTHYTEGD